MLSKKINGKKSSDPLIGVIRVNEIVDEIFRRRNSIFAYCPLSIIFFIPSPDYDNIIITFSSDVFDRSRLTDK